MVTVRFPDLTDFWSLMMQLIFRLAVFCKGGTGRQAGIESPRHARVGATRRAPTAQHP